MNPTIFQAAEASLNLLFKDVSAIDEVQHYNLHPTILLSTQRIYVDNDNKCIM